MHAGDVLRSWIWWQSLNIINFQWAAFLPVDLRWSYWHSSLSVKHKSWPLHQVECTGVNFINIYVRIFRTKFWRQSQNVIRKAAKKDGRTKKAREKTLMKLTPCKVGWATVSEIDIGRQGGDSQNFLRKFLIFFLTLGLKILRLKWLKVVFEADIIKGWC